MFRKSLQSGLGSINGMALIKCQGFIFALKNLLKPADVLIGILEVEEPFDVVPMGVPEFADAAGAAAVSWRGYSAAGRTAGNGVKRACRYYS